MAIITLTKIEIDLREEIKIRIILTIIKMYQFKVF